MHVRRQERKDGFGCAVVAAQNPFVTRRRLGNMVAGIQSWRERSLKKRSQERAIYAIESVIAVKTQYSWPRGVLPKSLEIFIASSIEI